MPRDVPPAVAAAQDTITGLMARRSVPGMSVAVTDADRLLFAGGFGLRDLGTGAPATPHTRYLWFSMSKIATATAAMHLADAGRHLDAPVSTYVPRYTARSGTAPGAAAAGPHRGWSTATGCG